MALLAGQCPRAIDGASHVLSANRQGYCGQNDPFAIGRFIAEAERCLQMLDDQLASSGGFSLGQRCTLVDVACFYCASAYWANVDISAMSHLLAWIEMLHQRPSFSTGLTVLSLGLLSWPSVCDTG